MTAPMPTPDDPGRALAPASPGAPVPALIAAAGEDAARHFLQFFLAHIRNPHTRRAYARQVRAFLEWCARRGVADVRAVQPEHVAAYVELLGRREDLKATSVKQALAARHGALVWGEAPAAAAASAAGGGRVMTRPRGRSVTGCPPCARFRSLPPAVRPPGTTLALTFPLDQGRTELEFSG